MTHLTWLDYYVAGAQEALQQQVPAQNIPQTDREAQFLMAIASLSHSTSSATAGRKISDTYVAQQTFFSGLIAFTAPRDMPKELGFAPPLGIKLSSRLAKDLSRAKAPDTADWLVELRRATWYIDVPHGAMLVGQHQIRAIFTQPTPHRHDEVAVVLVLTHFGSDAIAGRFAWMITGGNDDMLHGSADTDIDYDLVRHAATHFLALVLLYHRQVESDYESAQDAFIPAVGVDHAKLSRKKQQAKQKTRSLFRIRELYEPENRFGRTDTTITGNPWHLDHRVKVRGHFRWQPHGEQRSDRKLIWIAPHERGPDIEKPLMDSLRKNTTIRRHP